MVLYGENPKESTKNNLLELINEFNKVIRYKNNIQKAIVFLSTSDEPSKKEIKKTIPFIVE